MRQSKTTAAEIEEAELGEYNRKAGRLNGFKMMEERDRSWSRMSNGMVIEWNVPEERMKEGRVYSSVPKGKFLLHTNKEHLLLDADEVLKCLRWV